MHNSPPPPPSLRSLSAMFPSNAALLADGDTAFGLSATRFPVGDDSNTTFVSHKRYNFPPQTAQWTAHNQIPECQHNNLSKRGGGREGVSAPPSPPTSPPHHVQLSRHQPNARSCFSAYCAQLHSWRLCAVVYSVCMIRT